MEKDAADSGWLCAMIYSSKTANALAASAIRIQIGKRILPVPSLFKRQQQQEQNALLSGQPWRVLRPNTPRS
jgi:hypothetical protein